MRGHIRRRADAWELRVCVGKDPSSGKYRYRTRTVAGTRADAEREMELFVHEVAPFGALLERWYGETPETSLPCPRAEVRRLIDYRLFPLGRLEPREVRLIAQILDGALALERTE